MFNGKLLGPLDAIGWHTSDPFDYVVFEITYGPGYGGPQNFGGYSGGGIWQLIMGGVPTITGRHLMGVAYCQSDLIERGKKTIRDLICHGRESIYRALIDKVRAGAVTEAGA